MTRMKVEKKAGWHDLDPDYLYECPVCHETTLVVSAAGRLWCRRLQCGFFAFEGEHTPENLRKTEQRRVEKKECFGCRVILGPDAVHANSCVGEE